MGNWAPKHVGWLPTFPLENVTYCVCLSPTTVHRIYLFSFYLRCIPPFTPPICSRWAEKKMKRTTEELEAPGMSSTHFMTAIRQCRQTLSASFFSMEHTRTHTQEMIPLWLEIFFRMNLKNTKREKRLAPRYTTCSSAVSRMEKLVTVSLVTPRWLSMLSNYFIIIFPFFSRFRLSLPAELIF